MAFFTGLKPGENEMKRLWQSPDLYKFGPPVVMQFGVRHALACRIARETEVCRTFALNSSDRVHDLRPLVLNLIDSIYTFANSNWNPGNSVLNLADHVCYLADHVCYLGVSVCYLPGDAFYLRDHACYPPSST